MMWDINGTSLTIQFENWVPHRVLYDFDGPQIFTIQHELCDFLTYALRRKRGHHPLSAGFHQ
jgi:hypothetical protein